MRLIGLAFIGFCFQTLCIAAFVFASQTPIASAAKPCLYVAAAVGVALLLWTSLREPAGHKMTFSLLPLFLAFGNAFAFHAVGALAYPGLLRDFDLGQGYLLKGLGNVAILAVIFYLAAGIMFLVRKCTSPLRPLRWR